MWEWIDIWVALGDELWGGGGGSCPLGPSQRSWKQEPCFCRWGLGGNPGPHQCWMSPSYLLMA